HASEAAAVFERMLRFRNRLPSETVAHTLLGQSEAFQQLGDWGQALERAQQVPSLGKKDRVPVPLVGQAERKSLEIRLTVQEITRRALEEAQQRLEAEVANLTASLEQERATRQALELQLTAERAIRQALEIQLSQFRYRFVDSLNFFVKRKVPRLHSLAKAWAVRLMDWRRGRKKNKLEKLSPTPPAPKRSSPRPAASVPKRASLPSSRPLPAPRPPVQRVTAELAACTIIAKNHLSKARVLVDSFLRHHPGCPFFVLLVDHGDGFFDLERESFHLVEADQLDIPNPTKFFFHYDVLECSTAVKPYFLKHLLENHKLKNLIYFDPDILITSSLSAVFSVPDSYSFVITPHLTAPYEDSYRPGEFEILQAGVYNLGFLAIRDTEVAHRMLLWWQDRLYDKCLMAPERGWHVDQKWFDLVPGLFGDVHVLRDPGYNVAYWNLHERRVQVRNGEVTVNDRPCAFFHFSGFDPEKPKTVSKHQNRFRMEDIEEASILFGRYRDLVLAAGWTETKSWPYNHDYFDNGARISPTIRQLYRSLAGEALRFGDPFSTKHAPNFFDWLNEAMDQQVDPLRRITRLWYTIYQQRPDVRITYPDIFGVHRLPFLEWVISSGQADFAIDPHFVLHNKKDEERVERIPVMEAFPLTPSETEPSEPCRVEGGYFERPDLPLGVNVAGYVRSEKGVGEALRAAVRALEAVHFPFVINAFEDLGSENTESGPAIDRLSDSNPHRINLVYVNADQVPVFQHQKDGYFHNRYNIGCWNWELSSFPPEWQGSFECFNEIWVPSNFVREAVGRVSPIPVVRMPYPINPDREVLQTYKRSSFRLPSESFVFLYLFDFHSYAERKNPMAVIRAFKQAFSDEKDVFLLVKCSHSNFAPLTLARLQEECRGANIRLYDAVLPSAAVHSLMSLCDCYVSLHRSEGFGLTLLEAMSLGKPVIATAYSGNMDFTTPRNSFLVRYRLVEIGEDHGPYKKGWFWADPDLNHAAELMRQVYTNREQAAAVGGQAREDVNRDLHPTAVGRMMRERFSLSTDQTLEESPVGAEARNEG
ncbi:MAG: glycosyltransferase, partial [Acidobacteria bacterium]|nr:glycosyltransferase [Acidobacteriota bacterium]